MNRITFYLIILFFILILYLWATKERFFRDDSKKTKQESFDTNESSESESESESEEEEKPKPKPKRQPRKRVTEEAEGEDDASHAMKTSKAGPPPSPEQPMKDYNANVLELNENVKKLLGKLGNSSGGFGGWY